MASSDNSLHILPESVFMLMTQSRLVYLIRKNCHIAHCLMIHLDQEGHKSLGHLIHYVLVHYSQFPKTKKLLVFSKKTLMFIGPESGVPKTFALLIRSQFSIRERFSGSNDPFLANLIINEIYPICIFRPSPRIVYNEVSFIIGLERAIN